MSNNKLFSVLERKLPLILLTACTRELVATSISYIRTVLNKVYLYPKHSYTRRISFSFSLFFILFYPDIARVRACASEIYRHFMSTRSHRLDHHQISHSEYASRSENRYAKRCEKSKGSFVTKPGTNGSFNTDTSMSSRADVQQD